MLRTLKPLLNPSNPIRSPPLSSHFSQSPALFRQRDINNTGSDESNRDPDGPPKLFVVQPRIRPDYKLKSKLEEALNLANSLEEQRDGFYETKFLDKEMPHHLVVQNPLARQPRADTFFGDGTVSTIKCHINNLETKDEVDAVFVNAMLTGIQQRNLERRWEKPVLDRVGLIIEIFNAHAQTKEAKLQAELAALMYKRSRLVRVRGPGGRLTFGVIGEAEVVSARGRGSAGRGFISGAGETELQLQRRRIIDRRKKLLSEIKEVRGTRATQRAARKRPGHEIATVAVVGYTNAGKSTLVSALSNSYLYCDDRLFATVDPKLRGIVLPSGREVLLSDTVGFISDLPVQLVEAFHATLEEVVEADLLVHVLDSSAPDLDEHREAVMQVLEKLGVSQEKLQNMIEVWNKVDLEGKKLDFIEADNEDYASNCSGDEDADAASNQLSATSDIDEHTETEASEHGEDNIVHEQVGESDGWLSCEEEESSWFDYDAGSIGCETLVLQENKSSREFQSGCNVRTSAVTALGLKELLDLIDEKLGPSNVVDKRSIFDRKWRPSRDDSELAGSL